MFVWTPFKKNVYLGTHKFLPSCLVLSIDINIYYITVNLKIKSFIKKYSLVFKILIRTHTNLVVVTGIINNKLWILNANLIIIYKNNR
jgi:hypothetical protein